MEVRIRARTAGWIMLFRVERWRWAGGVDGNIRSERARRFIGCNGCCGAVEWKRERERERKEERRDGGGGGDGDVVDEGGVVVVVGRRMEGPK